MPDSVCVPRVSVALAALLAASAGCTMTSLTARNARVPVIVGPVACIDCAPAPAADGQAAPIADTVTHRNGDLALRMKTFAEDPKSFQPGAPDPTRTWDAHVAGVVGAYEAAGAWAA